MQDLKATIREIPDWPKKGILFYDVTTLLKNADAFHQAVNALIAPFRKREIDLVVGIEARGFIFAPIVSYSLKAGFVPVRKPGKLPAATHRARVARQARSVQAGILLMLKQHKDHELNTLHRTSWLLAFVGTN